MATISVAVAAEFRAKPYRRLSPLLTVPCKKFGPDISNPFNSTIWASPGRDRLWGDVFSNGSMGSGSFERFRRFGRLRSLRARSALDGVSWVQGGLVEIAVGQ